MSDKDQTSAPPERPARKTNTLDHWLNWFASLDLALAAPASNSVSAAGIAPLSSLDPSELRARDHVVVFLIDGFGCIHLRDAPALKQAQRTTLQSVIPSTTTAAIHTLLSGQPPTAHALLGWTVHSESKTAFQALTARTIDWGAWTSSGSPANRSIAKPVAQESAQRDDDQTQDAHLNGDGQQGGLAHQHPTASDASPATRAAHTAIDTPQSTTQKAFEPSRIDALRGTGYAVGHATERAPKLAPRIANAPLIAPPTPISDERLLTLIRDDTPTFAQRVAHGPRPRRVFHHSPAKIADSTYNRVMSRGAEIRPYVTLDNAISDTIACVAQCASLGQPSYHYLYWSALDTSGHRHGPDDPRVRAQVRELDSAFIDLAQALSRLERQIDPIGGPPLPRLDKNRSSWSPGSTRRRSCLIVTADHGMCRVDHPIDLASFEFYRDLIRPLSGEPRLGFLHVRESARNEFAARFVAMIPAARIWSRTEWNDRGGFGPAAHRHPQLDDRVGDFVIEPPPGAWWIDSRIGACPSFRGAHGGLSASEREVPLIVV